MDKKKIIPSAPGAVFAKNASVSASSLTVAVLCLATIVGTTTVARAQSQTSEPGFYVKTEAGGSWLAAQRGNWASPGFGDPVVYHRLSRPQSLVAGFAVGLQPYAGIRTELAYFHLARTGVSGLWAFTVPASPGPHADMNAHFTSNMFMVNAYVEPLAFFGSTLPIQPFIGGGVGVGLNDMGPWTRTNLAEVPITRTFERGHRANFAWNLAAGVSLGLGRWTGVPMFLDLTYRYIDAGEVRGGSQPFNGTSVPRRPFNFNLSAHVVTAGLRMAIGGPFAQAGLGLSRNTNFALPQARNQPYVAICEGAGQRFFLIPGTDTCLAIGGNVRAEFGYITPKTNGENATGFAARGQVELDARTPTDFGLLQTFVRIETLSVSGVFGSGFAPNLDRAFVRFGGLLAGKAPSMFDFYSNTLNFAKIGGSEAVTNQVSYTMDFGGGYRFGLGIETSADRFGNVGDFFYSRSPPRVTAGLQSFTQRTPNIVAALRYDARQGLIGAAQVSAAIGQVRPNNTNGESAYGFAVQAGARFNLPMLASGDALWLQAAYAQGMLGYLGVYGLPTSMGFQSLLQLDAVPYANVLNNGAIRNELKLTRGYSLTAAYVHNWTPSISHAIYGSYVNVNYNSLAEGSVIPFIPLPLNIADTRIYQFGSSIVWSPVRGLQIGAEALYSRVDPKGSLNYPTGVIKSYEDQLSLRMRMMRWF